MFLQTMNRLQPFSGNRIAVAVSGGADSMALTLLLRDWCRDNHKTLFALTVDHGLRPAAAEEAQRVVQWLAALNVPCHVLALEKPKTDTRVQENARDNRYAALVKKCQALGIQDLFLGHHRDDQAETFLLRLAAGSGLDGLACMAPVRVQDGVRLCRPLLDVARADLVEICEAAGQGWIEDPSNENPDFARVRLRRALAGEGLTTERLVKTASRMARARTALEEITARTAENLVRYQDETAQIPLAALQLQPDEIQLRVLALVLQTIGGGGFRTAGLEALQAQIFAPDFPGATLGHCKIARRGPDLQVSPEKMRKNRDLAA